MKIYLDTLILDITKSEADSAIHPGACDEGILALSLTPRIKRQTKKLDVKKLREVLYEYGAWTDDELQDHEENIQRILWIACGNIVEGIR